MVTISCQNQTPIPAIWLDSQTNGGTELNKKLLTADNGWLLTPVVGSDGKILTTLNVTRTKELMLQPRVTIKNYDEVYERLSRMVNNTRITRKIKVNFGKKVTFLPKLTFCKQIY